MTINHLIGVGGSGCRAIESVVHFSAAGLGPKSMTLAFVDADRGNGNLQRSADLVGLYLRLFRALRRPGARDQLGAETPWLATDLQHGPNDFWSPVPDGSDQTLGTIFNYSGTMPPPERALFDALFSSRDGANEKTMPLNEGYRGRPHIGAAVTGARASTRSPFWKGIADLVRRPNEGEDVRIFLIGSIFGGTGASGFPSMARKIRRLMTEAGINGGVRIGGALLLPYFRYERPDGKRHQGAIASDVFLPQAQAALRYYEQMMRTAPVFDSLYMIGWPSLIEVGQCQPGGRSQVNPPMAPEMMVATAALRFFGDEEVSPGKLHVPGWAPDCDFDWSYVTLPRAGQSPKQAFGQLLRFAFAFQNVYRPYLADPDMRASVDTHPWFERLLTGALADPGEDDVSRLITDVGDYCRRVMQWAATVTYVSRTDAMGIKLFEAQALASNEAWNDGLAALHETLEPAHEDKFPSLVTNGMGSELWELYDDLTYEPPASGERFGVFLGTLYEQCGLDR